MENVLVLMDMLVSMNNVLRSFKSSKIYILGEACHCIPGCSSDPKELQCSGNGNCDCTTGGCSCFPAYYGINCDKNGENSIKEIDLKIIQPIVEHVKEKVRKKFGNE